MEDKITICLQWDRRAFSEFLDESGYSGGSLASMLPPFGFTALIPRGEDIVEAIHSLVQRREGMPPNLREKACLGKILYTMGYVWNPEIENLGSSVLINGLYQLNGLDGKYNIPREGDVNLSGGLRGSFLENSTQRRFGGPLVGRLITACPIKVIVGIEEETPQVQIE